MSPTPIRRHTVRARDGLSVSVVEFRDGPAPEVLFVHGSFGHARVWDPVVDALHSARRVLAIDLPGHGESERATDEARCAFPELVDDLVDVIRKLGLRPVVAGHSIGSALAMLLAIEHSDLLAGVVLMDIDPCPPPQQALHLNQVGAQTAKAYDTFERAFARESRVAAKASPEIHRHLAEHGYRKTAEGWEQGFDQGFLRSIRTWDYVPLLGAIAAPALVLRGAESTVSSPAGYQQLLDHIPGARGELIAGAGHQIHLEQPEPVADAIDRFLSSLG